MESFEALLQHYNSLIDDEVKEEWEIPKAGAKRPMSFGNVVDPA